MEAQFTDKSMGDGNSNRKRRTGEGKELCLEEHFKGLLNYNWGTSKKLCHPFTRKPLEGCWVFMKA